MFSKEQLEAIRQALVLLESADRILVQANLPVLASGVWEAGKCLSAAIAVFKNTLSGR